ncbi:MAG: hypothetical protein IPP79_18145 [Chitinophagaceae bacterium]|nr:hypothetical protein [Chitinophagaceae bacterium]
MAKSQSPTYKKEWTKIDSLVNKKGLTKNALTEVGKLYERAKKEKNDAQLMKSLLCKLSLQEAIEDDASIKNIQQLEKEIALTKEPAKSVLQNILARYYLNYFQNNRYNFTIVPILFRLKRQTSLHGQLLISIKK